MPNTANYATQFEKALRQKYKRECLSDDLTTEVSADEKTENGRQGSPGKVHHREYASRSVPGQALLGEKRQCGRRVSGGVRGADQGNR